MHRWTCAFALACAANAFAAPPGEEQTLALLAQARSRGCAGHAGTREPLHWSDAVARAAQRIDAGEKPLAALQKEGYRATRVFHATFSGYRTAADVADAFAHQYCNTLTEGALSDFGFRRSGNRWLLVLATPLQVPQL